MRIQFRSILMTLALVFGSAQSVYGWEVRPECVKQVAENGQPELFERDQLQNMFPNRNKAFDRFWFWGGEHIYPDNGCKFQLVGLAKPYRAGARICRIAAVTTTVEVPPSELPLEDVAPCKLADSIICGNRTRHFAYVSKPEESGCHAPVALERLVGIEGVIPDNDLYELISLAREMERIFYGDNVPHRLMSQKGLGFPPVPEEGAKIKLSSVGFGWQVAHPTQSDVWSEDWDGQFRMSTPLPAISFCSTKGFHKYRRCFRYLVKKNKDHLQIWPVPDNDVILPFNVLFVR